VAFDLDVLDAQDDDDGLELIPDGEDGDEDETSDDD